MWVLTDNDSAQYVRASEDEPHTFQIIGAVLCDEEWHRDEDWYKVCNEVICVDDYEINSQDFAEQYLLPYSYESVEEVRELYGLQAEQVIAECIFETNSWEYDELYDGTFEECEKFISNRVNMG